MREEYAASVEEVDSEDGEDVRVDGMGRRIFSDELRFRGGDLVPYGEQYGRRDVYAYQDDYSDSEDDSDEEDGEGVTEQQIALRDKEEALVQSALARIRRAQEKGKVEVKLRQDELAALENRRKRLQAAAAKAKSAQGSRKGSASEGKKSKKNSPPMATVPIMHPDIQYAAASSSDRPASRRRSNGKALDGSPQGPPPGAPGVMVEDAQGRVSLVPINYSGSPSRPRSSSSLSAKNYSGRQPQQGYPYNGGYLNGRHVSDNTRPPSSHSPRPLPHEEGWVDSRRSSLNSQMGNHDPFAYEVRRGEGSPAPPIMEEDVGRRYYSQPQGSYSQPGGIQYSNVIRTPYGYGGGDPRAYLPNSSSDPTMLRQRMPMPQGVEVEESEDELSVPSSKASPKMGGGKGNVPKRKPVGKKKGKR